MSLVIFDLDETVVGNLRRAAPGLDDTQVRSVLGSFLFSGDDVEKPAGVLSGGEKTRLSLALLVVSMFLAPIIGGQVSNSPASTRSCRSCHGALSGPVDLVIVNKFGKQEAEGRGLAGTIATALERDMPGPGLRFENGALAVEPENLSRPAATSRRGTR